MHLTTDHLTNCTNNPDMLGMRNKNEPSNPKRFVAEADDIEVGGKVRIKSGELPPIHGARPSTSSPAHPLPARQKPAPQTATGRKRR
jgi:hypothetical protein